VVVTPNRKEAAMAATDAATSPGIDITFARDLAKKVLDAWNSHDAEALLALQTEDIDYDDSSWPKQMHGHGDVKEFLESTWRAVPDLTFEFDDVLVDPGSSQIAHFWRASATQTGVWDPPGVAPTGRTIEFEGMFLGTVRDGQLCRVRVVYDVATIMRQLGLLPDAGSGGEHLIVALGTVRTRLQHR
jgi:steroid delta-isomerase-like uncharacterized protein